MKPISNRIMIPLMVIEIILIAVTPYIMGGFVSQGYFATLFIQLLTLVSMIIGIKARINWERNRDYQNSVKI
jgi:hypothetical protein